MKELTRSDYAFISILESQKLKYKRIVITADCGHHDIQNQQSPFLAIFLFCIHNFVGTIVSYQPAHIFIQIIKKRLIFFRHHRVIVHRRFVVDNIVTSSSA